MCVLPEDRPVRPETLVFYNIIVILIKLLLLVPIVITSPVCCHYLAFFLLHYFICTFLPLFHFPYLASTLPPIGWVQLSPSQTVSVQCIETSFSRILFLFNFPEGGGIKLLLNVSNNLPINRVSYARGLWSPKARNTLHDSGCVFAETLLSVCCNEKCFALFCTQHTSFMILYVLLTVKWKIMATPAF